MASIGGKYSRILLLVAARALLMLLALALPATAQESSQSKSGYKFPTLAGPSSTRAQLEEDDRVTVPLLRFPTIDRALKPWFNWKRNLNKNYGLSFGTDYTTLVQGLSDSLGEDSAAGSIFRIYGNWDVIGRDTLDTGSLIFKLQNRHRLGTEIPPQDLGFEAGYLGITGTPFSDFGWGLTNLFWKQHFNQRHFTVAFGGIDITDYLDIYLLTNPWTNFQNLVFLTDPTIPAPNQGLAAAMAAMATENIYFIGGLADANGDPTDPLEWFDTFFNDREYFYHFEVGWISSQKRFFFDNIHLTGWYVDERENAMVEKGKGVAISAAWFINDAWAPFLRIGQSDGGGALLETSVSTGVGYKLKESQDLIGLGLNWGQPPDNELDDQFTSELFYRLQLAQNLAFTPSLQFVVDPAQNPEEDVLWVFSLRMRLAL